MELLVHKFEPVQHPKEVLRAHFVSLLFTTARQLFDRSVGLYSVRLRVPKSPSSPSRDPRRSVYMDDNLGRPIGSIRASCSDKHTVGQAFYTASGEDSRATFHDAALEANTDSTLPYVRTNKRARLQSWVATTKAQKWHKGEMLAERHFGVIATGHQPTEGDAVQAWTDQSRCCAGCGSKTHDLMGCLQAGSDGLTKGCAKCNTLDHSFVHCPYLATGRNKLDILIEGRGNMPAFQDVKTWADIVRAVCSGLKTIHGERLGHLRSFPWSPSFARVMESQIPHLQAEMDRLGVSANSGFKLPVDPTTQDWAAIQRTCAHHLTGNFERLRHVPHEPDGLSANSQAENPVMGDHEGNAGWGGTESEQDK